MSDLDDKLKRIIYLVSQAPLDDEDHEFDNEFRLLIEAIKQAFADEGWVPNDGRPIFSYRGLDYMTGHGWYERFKKELWVPPKQSTRINQNDDGESHDRFFRSGGENFMYERAIEAAKKAAGLV